MASFVSNLLREARLALNYRGWRVRRSAVEGPDTDDSGTDLDLFDAGVLPSPLPFGDETYNGFCVREGFVHRVGTSDLLNNSPQLVSSWANRFKPFLRVSELGDRFTDKAVYSFAGDNYHGDMGVLATDDYVYIVLRTGNAWRLYQIRKTDHRVRTYNSGGNSLALLYDWDTNKVYRLRQLGTDFGISEIDEDRFVGSLVHSAGFTQIRLRGQGSHGITTPSGVNVETTPLGRVWYAKDGVAWNTILVRDTATRRRHFFLGVGSWRWGDLEAYINNGTTSTQYIEPAGTQIDVGADIGWRYDYDQSPNYTTYRSFSFCMDENDVGWVSYMNARDPNPDYRPINRAVRFSGLLATSLIRYDMRLATPGLISSVVYRWGEPGGYNFEYQKPTSTITTQQDIGSVVCQRQQGDTFAAFTGRYSVSGLPNDVGISWVEGEGTSLRFYVEPADYDDLTAGVYDFEVRYSDELGNSSVQVRISVLETGAGDTNPAPIFVGTPYTAQLAIGTSARTRIIQVEAVGADSYRFATTGNPQNLFDISAVSGEIFWRGTRAVADTDTSFALSVEAVNEGATMADDVVVSASVAVSVIDPDAEPYVAPSWNANWVPVGYQRVSGQVENITDFTDGYYKTIDISGGIVPGSVPLSEFRYNVVVGDTSIADAVWYEGSPIISFVGLGSGTTTFTIRVSDGQGAELGLVVFSLTWALPSLTATSLRWIQGAGEALATTSLAIPVLEGSLRQEVLTSGASQLYVDVGARSRDVNVFVEDGADIVSVELGGEATWDISGTTHYFRRVKVFTSGSNLDFETAPTRQVRLSASTSQEHIADTDYSAATSDLPVTINVGDSPVDVEPFVGYVPFQVNPGWRPLPVSPSAWVQHGAHTWRRDFAVGAASLSVDLEQSVIAGSQPVTFSVNIIRPDLGRYVLTGSDLTMNGEHPGSVVYQVSASDGATTRRVVDLNVVYSAQPTTQTQLILTFNGSTFPLGLNISVQQGAEEAEIPGGEFAVTMFGFNDREITFTSSVGHIVRAEVGAEDVSVGTRTGKQVRLFSNGLLVSEGDTITGTLTASVDEVEIGGVRWSASSVSVPLNITGTAAFLPPTRFRFFGGQDRNELNAVVFDTITEGQAEAEATFGHGGALYVWCSAIEAPRVISVESDRANVRAEVVSPGVDLGFHFDGQMNQVLRVHRVRVYVSGAGEFSPDLHPGTLTFSTPEVLHEGKLWQAGERGLAFSGSVLPDF